MSAVTEYRVRLELDEQVSRGPQASEIRGRLAEYAPVLRRNAHGKTQIDLHVDSLDIWLSLLTIMAAIKTIYYEPCAVEFIRADELRRRVG